MKNMKPMSQTEVEKLVELGICFVANKLREDRRKADRAAFTRAALKARTLQELEAARERFYRSVEVTEDDIRDFLNR